MNYNLPRPYLSASSIGTLMRCPKQFEFRYIDGIVSPPNIAMSAGTAVHAGFEFYYKDILDGAEERLKPEQVAEYSVSKLEEIVDEQDLQIGGEEKDNIILDVSNATEVYIKNVGEHVTPRFVEEEVRYTSKCGVEILAYLDLIREPDDFEQELNKKASKEEEVIDTVLADYKLTGKKWNIKQLQNSLQFNLYPLVTGILNVEIVNLVKGTKKTSRTPKKTVSEDRTQVDLTNNLRMLRHNFDGSNFAHMEYIIESAAKLIHSGIFMPCDPESWCCNESWCGYWNLCRGASNVNPTVVDMHVN